MKKEKQIHEKEEEFATNLAETQIHKEEEEEFDLEEGGFDQRRKTSTTKTFLKNPNPKIIKKYP